MVEDRKAVEVSHVYKSFGETTVVKDISFEVGAGEVFGLVGPNGAGKTTIIRMLLDIIKADSGEVKILGEVLQESTKNRIGYLPEERGLYRKITVSESLEYLAALKGFDRGLARERGKELLQRVGMLSHQRKKTDELSKGMGQLIQFLVTIIHDPDLVVLDEPFYGLDPVNVKLIKELILELKERGKTIMLSTHMMNEVEELCDRILMIDRGQAVLYGNLAEIKLRYRNNSVLLEGEGERDGIVGVTGSKDHGKYVELFLDGQTSPQEVLKSLMERGVRVDRFEVSTPSLNDIFIQVVEKGR